MIRESLRRIIALIKKEFITIWKDPKSRGIIIALPLMQLFVFANAITMEVKNIDVALIDSANTVEQENYYHVLSTLRGLESSIMQRMRLI